MRWRPAPADLALAVVVTAVMASDVGQAARLDVGLLLVLPAGLSFAWREQLPWVPLLLSGLANLVLGATAPGEFGPQTVVLGLLVAVYTAAAVLAGRTAVAAALVGLFLVWLGHVATREGDAADFFPFVVWGVPWLAGRLVRRQSLQARTAGARAALLEVEVGEAAGRERDRIARELHDVVAHAVSLMVVQAGAERLAAREGADASRTKAALEAIETTGRQALVELRTMLGVLRGIDGEPAWTPQPQLAAVPSLVSALEAAGLTVDLSVIGEQDVPPGVGLAAYRVIQEALTNALRHGRGSATVVIEVGTHVRLEVRNPRGRASHAGAGRGLIGMRERVELFGGDLVAHADGDEWVVRASLPLTWVGVG